MGRFEIPRFRADRKLVGRTNNYRSARNIFRTCAQGGIRGATSGARSTVRATAPRDMVNVTVAEWMERERIHSPPRARSESDDPSPSQPENGASARSPLESPAVKFADDAAHGQRRDVELTPSGRVKLRSSTIVQDLVRSAQSLDEEQIAEFKECFSLFDVDGSGSIDTSELKSVMTSLGQKMTDEELEQMIKNVDADGSGTVDFAEFLGMMALQMRDHDADVILERVFGRFAGVDERILVKHLNFVFAHLCEKMSGSEIESFVKEAARGEESMSFTQFMSLFRVTPPGEKPKIRQTR